MVSPPSSTFRWNLQGGNPQSYYILARYDYHNISYLKTCKRCQKGKRRKQEYAELPQKIAKTISWRIVCVDLIGPYTIKSKNGTNLDFMCLMIINPATGWFKIVEIPNADVTYVWNGKEVIEVIFDKSSTMVSQLFNKSWLSWYPRAKYIIYVTEVSLNSTSNSYMIAMD